VTFQELLTEINSLPLEERLILLEALTRGLRAELSLQPQAIAPVETVRGRLKPTEPMPTDEDVKDAYARYLIEKYT
jgi:hypothetical protein